MSTLEVWLRGEPVEDVPPLLQPVAHSLLQCRDEIGLLFHAAEHTQRHVGQATTTRKLM